MPRLATATSPRSGTAINQSPKVEAAISEAPKPGVTELTTRVQIAVTATQRAAIAKMVNEPQVARGVRSMIGIQGSLEIRNMPPGSNPAIIADALANQDYATANYHLALEAWNPVLSSIFPSDKPQPPPPLAEVGPLNWNPIVFSGGVPVGGWAELSLFPNGGVNFNGSFHDSGFPSYNDAIVFAVQAIATGDLFTFSHSGHMAGTIESGSRDDSWSGQIDSPAVAGAWPILSLDGYRWWAQAAVNIDLGSLLNTIKSIVSAVQTIGTIVAFVF